MKELNTRQWNLYTYLKKQLDWKTQSEIAAELSKDYACTKKDLENFHDSAIRSLMSNDIRAINESDTIQKIIIISSKGVKLATKDEAGKYIKARYCATFRQLKRWRKLSHKAGLDGQLKIVFGSEREVVQAFTDSNATGESLRAQRIRFGLSQRQACLLLRQYTHIDEPMLSRIENGVCLPTSEQSAAFEIVYR